MKILSVHLKGYDRFPLLESDELIYDNLDEKLQVIIGTNGSGKSSLLHAIISLIGHHDDFKLGGFQKVKVEHRNSIYEIISDFSSGNKYTIIKDSSPLIENKTYSICKEILVQEFMLTPDINAIMVGSTSFTEMSLSEKREWFTKLSHVDYTYVTKVYSNTKERLRDIQGAIRTNVERLQQLSSMNQSVSDLKEIEETIKQQKETYRQFMLQRENLPDNAYTTLTKLNTVCDDIKNIATSIIKQNNQLMIYSVSKKTSLTEKERLQAELHTLNYRMEECHQQIEQKQILFNTLQGSLLVDFENLDQEFDQVNTMLTDLKQKLYLPSVQFVTPHLAEQVFLTYRVTLEDSFIELVPCSSRKYTNEYHHSLQIKLKEQQEHYVTIDQHYNKILAQIKQQEHYASHDKTTCPSCKYEWSIGYNETLYRSLQNEKEKIYLSLETCKRTIEQYENERNDVAHYLQHFNFIKSVIDTTPLLNPLWEYLNQTQVIYIDPKSIPSIFQQAQYDLTVQIQISNGLDRLKELSILKDLLKQDQFKNKDDLAKTIDRYNDTYFQLNVRKTELQSQIKEIEQYHLLVSQRDNTLKQLETALMRREELAKSMVKHYKNDYCDEAIFQLNKDINEKERYLSDIQHRQSLLTSLEHSLEEQKEVEDVLKVIENILSPKEGLIAKGLISFINVFIEQMNKLISEMWTYPLEIQTFSIGEEVELNYRFSLVVNRTKRVKDIKFGSSAMKEVINLAFRIISMYYLKFHDYPLYLDEFAAKMDERHRKIAFKCIDQLLSYEDFSQIFIVSHHQELYESLGNKRIFVLDRSNVN